MITAITTPYIATASQNTIETRFLVLTHGAFITDPKIAAPVVNMPQIAPIIDSMIVRATPIYAQEYGLMQYKTSLHDYEFTQ